MFQGLRQLYISVYLIVQKYLQLVKWNKKEKKKNQQNRQKGRDGKGNRGF